MSLIPSRFILSSAIGLCASSLAIAYLIKKHIHSEDEEIIYEVLFFSSKGTACRRHFSKEIDKKQCSLPNCSFYNLSRMLHYLNSAERSLDVCQYMITVFDLSKAILRAQKRGVMVRVISDEDNCKESSSQISLFRKKGLSVKCPHSTMLMHHKFVVIDKHIVMTGSLNWTSQALCGNWDNLLITSQPQITNSFVGEFDKLWNELN